jgi:regulator of protease activity HflC (stomatin/prohibitin superfamily)
MREAIRAAFKEFTWAEAIGPKREAVEDLCFQIMKERLTNDGIIIEEVMLRDTTLPAELVSSLNQRAAAQIQIQTRQFEQDQARIAAETKVIEAGGLAKAKVVEAQGQAEAFDIIEQSILRSPDIMTYYWINKLGGNVEVYVVPTNSSYILPLPTTTTKISVPPTPPPTPTP